jgi:AcrR family transcriptional regulator
MRDAFVNKWGEMMSTSGKRSARTRVKAWDNADLREEQHEAKRRLILKQAAIMFADRGFHQTTIDQIAEALEVTKPTIYYYIDSKEDLLYQVALAALADLKEALAADHDASLPAIDRLERFFEIYGRLILSEFGICLALVSDRSLSQEYRRKLRSLKKQFEAMVQNIIADGRKDGTIVVEDAKIFTFAIFGAFNWATQWFSSAGTSNPEQIAAATFRVFRKSVERG